MDTQKTPQKTHKNFHFFEKKKDIKNISQKTTKTTKMSEVLQKIQEKNTEKIKS